MIGASGSLGRPLWKAYRKTFPDCLGTSQSGQDPLFSLDVRSAELGPLRLRERGYQAVILAAARPLIGDCERDPAATYEVNVRGTLDLVGQISAMGLQVIWFSSDYVFDGISGGYGDEATPSPSTQYGRHKAEVERAIPALTDNYLILRLSKVYSTTRGDRSWLDEMAAQLSMGGQIVAASDQIFSPTHVEDVVAVVQRLQALGARGLYNLACHQDWSRHQIAEALAAALGAPATQVRRVSLHDLPGMAGRPLNTTLRCHRLNRELGYSFRPLESSLAELAAQWGGS